MLAQIITENGQKKIIPLTADAGAGNPVGTIIPMYKKSNPSGYLYCDGSTFDETKYPLLYTYLGSNVLPDYREAAIVGAEQNTTDTIATHDVFTEGQFKDDQLQNHGHSITDPGHKHKLNRLLDSGSTSAPSMTFMDPTGSFTFAVSTERATTGITVDNPNSGTHGTVTRGKRKAVYFYIKATSGLSENAQDNVVAQLNEERSYSTTEINTGKKWIDGKPIYRAYYKTANFDPSSKIYKTYRVDSLNIEECINISGFIYRTKTGYKATYPLNFYETSTMLTLTKYENSDNRISLITQIDDCTDTYAVIFLEYTKTTD